MLYRRTITEEYLYETEDERSTHVASRTAEGFEDSGQLRERVRPAVMVQGGIFPVWENIPDDFRPYSRLTKVETEEVASKPEADSTHVFGLDKPAETGLSSSEIALRNLHALALRGAGRLVEVRDLANKYYLELLALVR